MVTVTAIVVWSCIQFQHVPLSSDALVRMARLAESGIPHLSSTAVISGTALAPCTLAWAPRYPLVGTIHHPELLCSVLPHSPHRVSPPAVRFAGVRENSKPQQL